MGKLKYTRRRHCLHHLLSSTHARIAGLHYAVMAKFRAKTEVAYVYGTWSQREGDAQSQKQADIEVLKWFEWCKLSHVRGGRALYKMMLDLIIGCCSKRLQSDALCCVTSTPLIRRHWRDRSFADDLATDISYFWQQWYARQHLVHPTG